jgi:hypothetical protein
MNEEFIDSFLTDQEKDAVRASVADNPLVFGALQKIILADVYFKGVLRKKVDADPTRNAAYALAFSQTALPNEVLGADIRAQAEGVRLVEMGFKRVLSLKSDKPVTGTKPTGR